MPKRLLAILAFFLLLVPFGSAIAELLGENHPVPIRRVGIKDRFGESGEPNQLMKHFGLTADDITKTAHSLMTELGRQ